MKYVPVRAKNFSPVPLRNRRSIRLRGYDYSQAGAYFVTACTQNRKCLFGNIVNGEMVLNDAGVMIKKWYTELQNKFLGTHCDECVMMPNHVHFIVINVGADLRVCPDCPDLRVCPDCPDLRVCPDCPDLRVCPNDGNGKMESGAHDTGAHDTGAHDTGAHTGAPLPEIVQWFKTMTTNAYIRGVKQNGWTRFDRKLWQRNYWEHIVRNENELNRIREYIQNNPTQWGADRLYGPSSNDPNSIREPSTEYATEAWML